MTDSHAPCVRESEKQLPVSLCAGVVVCGGGIAGIAAALLAMPGCPFGSRAAEIDASKLPARLRNAGVRAYEETP